MRDPDGRQTAQIALPSSPRHRRERTRDSTQEKIQCAVLEQPQQQIELGAIRGARQSGDLAGDVLTQIGRGVLNQRVRDGAQNLPRSRRECQRSWTNVSLKPSGSVIM